MENKNNKKIFKESLKLFYDEFDNIIQKIIIITFILTITLFIINNVICLKSINIINNSFLSNILNNSIKISFLEKIASIIKIIFGIFYLLILMFLYSYTTIYFYKKIYKNEIYKFKDFFSNLNYNFILFYLFYILSYIILAILMIPLFIPFIYYSIYWSFWPIIFLNEKKTFFESIKKSKKIIKNNWKKTFFYNLIFLILLIIILFLIHNFFNKLTLNILIHRISGSLNNNMSLFYINLNFFIISFIMLVLIYLLIIFKILFFTNYYLSLTNKEKKSLNFDDEESKKIYSYLKENLKKGYSFEDLKNSLINNGYNENKIYLIYEDNF